MLRPPSAATTAIYAKVDKSSPYYRMAAVEAFNAGHRVLEGRGRLAHVRDVARHGERHQGAAPVLRHEGLPSGGRATS